MYGQVHLCIRSLVLEKFGEEKWKAILEKSGCDPIDDFLTFRRYDDSATFTLIGSITEVLGVPLETVLELFGEYFFIYCYQHGYDKMLKTLGDDFQTFIQNLDSLHALLVLTYKNIDAPSFRCETTTDGTLLLHYYSSRKGLYPIVVGLCRSVGRELYEQTVTMEVVEISEEDIGQSTVHHVTFRVMIEGGKVCDASSINGVVRPVRQAVVMPTSSLITPSSFCEIFPFHILFDSDLVIRQLGSSITRWTTNDIGTELRLDDLFDLVKPKMPLTYDHIHRFSNANYILETKKAGVDELLSEEMYSIKTVSLILRGQMVRLENEKMVLFIGSPRLKNLNEMEERNFFLSDIPLYVVTRELVLLNHQRTAELEVTKKLDETTAELKRTGFALEKEKAKTDMLLYQMLPEKVANSLRNGQRVDAEKFDTSTILFSDIVSFTNIAAAVQPIQIVAMLNDLYMRFDNLTNTHDVYKVETIGDAYMIVGGVPERDARHAQKVANFSLDMVEQAREVKSPATGKPLQIRVGIHSGPVVSGVVGDKMPRYCLFGDTVNTASRMESHGEPGKIHVSPFTYQALKDHNYKFEDRGQINVKDKGLMFTYFLIYTGAKYVYYYTSTGQRRNDVDGCDVTQTAPTAPATDHQNTAKTGVEEKESGEQTDLTIDVKRDLSGDASPVLGCPFTGMGGERGKTDSIISMNGSHPREDEISVYRGQQDKSATCLIV